MGYAGDVQKGFATNIALVVALIVVLLGGFLVVKHPWGPIEIGPLPPASPPACPQDAKVCPDGSAIGRTGPNCEFAECPKGTINPTATPSAQTRDWKTFKTERYSLKIPPNWSQIKPTAGGCGPVLESTDNSFNGWITICGPYQETPEKIIKQLTDPGIFTITNQHEVAVGGKKGIQLEYSASPDQSQIDTYIGDDSLTVYMFIKDQNQKNEARKILDNVLSTFQFN